LHGVKTAPDHFLGDYPNVKFQGFARAIRKTSVENRYLISDVMRGFIP
jgi:hypothetical protein